MNFNNPIQKCGPGIASAFGGTGNNTNASASSLNGNRSVSNSNTNRAGSFAHSYQNHFLNIQQVNIPGNMTNKVEKIATTTDIQKAVVSESRSVSVRGQGNNGLHLQNVIPFLEGGCFSFTINCTDFPTEIGENTQLIMGIKTKCKHKRLRGLKAFLVDRNIIKQAIMHAFENKERTPQLTWIEHHIKETVERIRHELLTKTYKQRPYRFRTIRNKEEKTRHLAILGFYDRCVQQLLKDVIQEKLRALEPRNVYSNLPGRGTLSNNATYCLYLQLRHDFKAYKDGYALELDIHHCYESIKTEVIKRELFRYVTDNFTRWLISELFGHIKSLPIRDPLAGLVVNLVLRRWHMHLLEHRHELFDKCYFFCDDALFINKSSKKALHQLCQESRKWLYDYAGLHIKKNYQVYKLSEGVTFCGVRAFPEKILIKQITKKRMIKKSKNPRALASYKGILDKTSSAHLGKTLGMSQISERVRQYNLKKVYGRRNKSKSAGYTWEPRRPKYKCTRTHTKSV